MTDQSNPNPNGADKDRNLKDSGRVNANPASAQADQLERDLTRPTGERAREGFESDPNANRNQFNQSTDNSQVQKPVAERPAPQGPDNTHPNKSHDPANPIKA